MPTVLDLTVDLVGTMRVPISLAGLVAAARETMGQLLGIDDPPEIEVFADRRYDRDGVVYAGRRVEAPELRSVMIGEHARGALFEPSTHRRFNLETSTGDGAVLWGFGHCGTEGCTGPPHEVSAVFSPVRTCAGVVVVVSTALALAAAARGRGDYVDIHIMMLQPPEEDPERVIELTRLPDRGQDFGRRCERYLRQFAHLDGWPPDVDNTG